MTRPLTLPHFITLGQTTYEKRYKNFFFYKSKGYVSAYRAATMRTSSQQSTGNQGHVWKTTKWTDLNADVLLRSAEDRTKWQMTVHEADQCGGRQNTLVAVFPSDQ